MNPHVRALQSIAIIGILLGAILTIFGIFSYSAAALLPIGIMVLGLGVLAYLLATTAQAITWRAGDK